MKLAMIVAQDENRVIGVDNQLPWRISADLQYFKANTLGKPIIMGRKTFESIGRPLPGRTNIVVTRQADLTLEGAEVCLSLEEAISRAQVVCEQSDANEAVVIGGDQIYQLALPLAARVYLTQVHGCVEGDAWFPELAEADWSLVSDERHTAGEKDSFDYSFRVYERVAG